MEFNIVTYTLWLFCVAFSLAGVQFVYSSQFALGGPLFNTKFGISNSIVNVILTTAGPVSGFIVQPIVGTISDKYTARLGRRRWFIIIGCLFTAAGMVLIACSVLLGQLLGDNTDSIFPSDHKAAIALSIAGLWIMNLFTNVIQGPARALVNDVTDPEQLQLANATTAGVMALSAVGANLVGAQFLSTSNPYFIIFLIGAGFLVFSMVPTVIAGKEIPYDRPDYEDKLSIKQVFVQIFVAFKEMPRAMMKIVVIYFFSWVAYTPLMINQTLLFQHNVFPHRKDNYGVMLGMYGSALFSTLAFNFALVLPYVIKALGPKLAYIITQVIATGCYATLWGLPTLDPWPALILTSVTAFNFTAFNSIPFAITTEVVGTEKCGLYMGVLNSASVVAQAVSGALVSVVLSWKDNDVRWGIGLGAVFSVLAIIAALFLETSKKDKPLHIVTHKNNEESGPLITPQ